MTEEIWSKVDDYYLPLVAQDDALRLAVTESEKAGLPSIQVAPNQGKLLHLLARIRGARSILEVGTLGGYSTIWLARALPKDGKLVTLEIDPKHADVAKKNLAHADIHNVDVRVGRAIDTLEQMKKNKEG
ncbi:MAG: O-methyltransferase, partial [Polyangiaceae bacterium]